MMAVAALRAGRAERIVLAAASAVAAAMLALALAIAPDPRGHSTHERLGLPPCGLLVVTGVPCPSCGMTTAFAHAARLEVLAAARAQPVGLLFALATAALAIAGPVAVARGTPLLTLAARRLPDRVGLQLIGLILAGWAYKVAVTLYRSPT